MLSNRIKLAVYRTDAVTHRALNARCAGLLYAIYNNINNNNLLTSSKHFWPIAFGSHWIPNVVPFGKLTKHNILLADFIFFGLFSVLLFPSHNHARKHQLRVHFITLRKITTRIIIILGSKTRPTAWNLLCLTSRWNCALLFIEFISVAALCSHSVFIKLHSNLFFFFFFRPFVCLYRYTQYTPL